VQTQSVTLQLFINPLVNWIWMGFGVLAFGTLIALLPERTFAFATARVAEGAASAATTTTLLLLAALLVSPLSVSVARAQTPAPLPSGPPASPGGGGGGGGHTEGASEAFLVPKTPIERELQHEIICMCGTCGRRRVGECTCSIAASMRGEIAALVAQGKSREQVYEYFMAKYGSEEPLASPIDKGFNRLAWALPYVVGSFGAVTAVVLARKWSRMKPAGGVDAVGDAGDLRTATAGAGAGPRHARDSQLEERLADELRDLD